MNGYSACLNGVNCKYNGKNNLRAEIRQKIETEGGVLLCPEQAGGLGIPHPPSEIETGYDGRDVLAGRAKVLDRDGRDVTQAFVEGAQRTLQKVLANGVKTVYLKQSSPSCGCYERALESGDEDVRHTAADALFGFYCRKEQYETAEAYLVYLPEQNPEKKRKQAELYSKTGRMQEAYKAYEELLFSSYQMIYMVLYGITMLAMQQKNLKKAHYLVEKQTRLVHLFEMGPYYEASAGLTLAIEEKDVDGTLEAMAGILGSVQNICAFCQSPLYEHMTFKSPRREFVAQLKKNLLERFRDEETFDFLKTDKRWEELVK